VGNARCSGLTDRGKVKRRINDLNTFLCKSVSLIYI